MIDPAKRLSGGDDAKVLRAAGAHRQTLKKGRGEVGKVYRGDQNSLVDGVGECRIDAAKWPEAGDGVFERDEAEVGVAVRGSEYGDVPGDLADKPASALEHRFTATVDIGRQKSFILPHAAAVTTRQNEASEPRDVHEKIVTADSLPGKGARAPSMPTITTPAHSVFRAVS